MKIVNKIFDVIEVYLPMISFSIVFISYIVIIFYRYVFLAQMAWINELNSIAFIWCGVFAASYGARANKSVAFPILYDKLSERNKLVLRLISNLIIITLIVILIPTSFDRIMNLAIRKTPIIKMPYSVFFFPFIISYSLLAIHHIVLFVRDIKLIKSFKKGKNEQ